MSKLTQPLSLRVAMPFTTAVIDYFRSVFGQQEIDAVIKAGIRGEPVFYAREGGQEIGTRSAPPTVFVRCSEMELIVAKPDETATVRGRKRAA